MTWYEDEVKSLEEKRSEYAYPPETIFYGSSSIRLWETLSTDFSDYKPANLGFGGSTLAACVWFFDRLITPLKPRRIVFTPAITILATEETQKKFLYFSSN